MRAIVFGSTALRYHGFDQIKPRDLDLIVDEQLAMELAWNCQSKRGRLLKFVKEGSDKTSEETVVDVVLPSDNKTYESFLSGNMFPVIIISEFAICSYMPYSGCLG